MKVRNYFDTTGTIYRNESLAGFQQRLEFNKVLLLL